MAEKLKRGQFEGRKVRFSTWLRFLGSSIPLGRPILTQKPAKERAAPGLSFESRREVIGAGLTGLRSANPLKTPKRVLSENAVFEPFHGCFEINGLVFFQIRIEQVEVPLEPNVQLPISEPQGAISPQS